MWWMFTWKSAYTTRTNKMKSLPAWRGLHFVCIFYYRKKFYFIIDKPKSVIRLSRPPAEDVQEQSGDM